MDKRNLIAGIIIILAFTSIDYIAHKYLESVASLEIVPQDYFINKILYGVPLLILALLLVDKMFPHASKNGRVSIITLAVILPLQLRYIQLYNQKFNLIVIILHYIALGIPIYIAQKRGNI